MVLRDKLAAKQRRRATYPVQVSDPGAAAERAARARQALAEARFSPSATREDVRARESDVEAAEALLAEHVVQVDFEALPGDDFEALCAEHTVEDIDGEAGIDSVRMLPALAAACAVDEELRDEDWWAGQLPDWTKGEKDNLYALLFTHLNYSIPRAAVSKG